MTETSQDYSRRSFVRTTALVGALAMGSGQVAGQSSRSGKGHPVSDTVTLTHGVVAGDVTDGSAVIWGRAESDAYLHVELSTGSGFNRKSKPVEVTEETDYTGQILLEGLEPNTEYDYRMWATTIPAPGSPSEDDYQTGAFKTAPTLDQEAGVTFTWTGDSYGFGEDPIEPPFESFKSMAEQRPDFFLYLGDTIYSDAQTPAGKITEDTDPDEALPIYRGKYKEVRDPPASIAETSYLRDLLDVTSVYAMWDDHEVINNFAGSVNPLMPVGRRAFFDYWPLNRDSKKGASENPNQLYGSFRWGKHLEMFILDTRQYRDPNVAAEDKNLLGEEQLAWFKDALDSSDATFKVVANPAPFGYPTDSWYNFGDGLGYEDELWELMDFVTENDIENVVVVAGDIHQPYISSYDPDHDGNVEIYEAVAGAMGAPGNAPMGQFNGAMNPTHFWGAEEHLLNYGTVDVDEIGESLTISIHAEDGTERYAKTIHADGNDGGDIQMQRFATTAKGAEITGIHITRTGKFFLNVQHPDAENQDVPYVWSPREYNQGAVGVVPGADMHDLPMEFEEVPDEPAGIFDEQVNTAFGEHQVLANGGDMTIDGIPVKDDEGLGVAYTPDGEAMTEANSPDFNGFVPTAADDTEGYLFTDWESVPGMISRMKVVYNENEQEPVWTVENARNLDLRDIGGTWVNCFGSVTPWNTPLSSEEYEPDAEEWFVNGGSGYESMTEYLGEPANVYRYGYVVEIEDPTADDPSPQKRFAMGRKSNENSRVMPDERTVYFGDDGSHRMFFKFVADEPGDLSSGTLYAAKLTQDDTTDPATAGFDVEWIELAHGADDDIESWVAEYDGQTPGNDADYITRAEVQQWVEGNNPYDDQRIPFLEPRKAATALGATNEWLKMEGVQIRWGAQPGDYLYMAVSKVGDGMTDGEGDIQLDPNPYGAIYRMRLDDDYDVSRIEPAVLGSEETFHNPDNILVMDDGRVIIGEDTGRPNDMVWVYLPDE